MGWFPSPGTCERPPRFKDYSDMERAMLRTILAGFFVLSLATIPQAVAQQEQADAPATEIDSGVVGLPIHTSDGNRLV